jgi:hypothetical protein
MSKKIRFYTIYIILIVFISIVAAESVFNIFNRFSPGFLNKYSFRTTTKLDYGDVWRKNGMGEGGYLKENFSDFVIDGYGGKVFWKNNAQGFRRDNDTRTEHDDKLLRIFSLGDSFAVGYRVGQDQAFSSLLERCFNDKKDSYTYEVLMSCIEDPVDGYFYLSNTGIKFKPDMVVLGLTLGNDISQSFIALDPEGKYTLEDSTGKIVNKADQRLGFLHGLENKTIPMKCFTYGNLKREDENKNIFNKLLTYKLLKKLFGKYEGESIISWYGDKGAPRLHDACNGLGEYLVEQPNEVAESYNRLFRIINAYKILSRRYGFTFVIVLFPQRFQIQDEDWVATRKDYRLTEECFDLMKPNRLIMEFCNKNGIFCIDPTNKMKGIYKTKRKSLYFPFGDMHLNADGNSALYDSIKDEIYAFIKQRHIVGRTTLNESR